MDFAATQIYEEEDVDCTQRISETVEEKESIQVGVLSIDSTVYEIKSGTTKIGRLSTSDICINHPSVSKIHAEIEADAGQSSAWISDLLSANKTKLNNSILRPKRLYELKDESVIDFGKVRAVYRTYRPTNDIVIPETPAPTRQKVTGTIIPNTPDSSINSSSVADDDGSIIFGTQQTEQERNVFRRPSSTLPKRQSTSIDNKNTSRGASMNESDDSQIDIRLRVSVNDSSESQGVSIHDIETQKYEEGRKTAASSSIHDMETQNILASVPSHLEKSATAKKQLSTLHLRDKVTGGSAINISDMETQNYTDDNEQRCAGKSKTDIPNTKKSTKNIHDLETQNYIVDTAESKHTDIQDATGKQLTANIHDLETQNYLVDTAKNIRATTAKKPTINIHDLETQKYIVGATEGNIDIRDATAKKSMTNIHDLETQNCLIDSAKNTQNTVAKKPAMNIHDLETQNYVVDSAKNNTGTRKLGNDKNYVRTTGVDQIERGIHDLETQNVDNERSVEDIYDMETQLELKGITSESSNSANKNNTDKNKDMPDTAKSGISCENAAKLPMSRSSSLESLDLSSPGIDENCPSSPLNESAHLLESSDLLKYFADGIDKPKECNASTPKPRLKTSSQKNNARDTADASDNEDDNQEDNIHDLPTQCIDSKSRVSLSDDSETDEEKTTVKRKAPKKKHGKPRPTQINDDSETDAEEYLQELAKKQGESSTAPSKPCNTNVENNNDPETSADSDDMFNMPTQKPKNQPAKNTSSSPINQQPETNRTDAVVDDMAPTQKIGKRGQDDRLDVLSADIDDMAPTQPFLPCKAPPKTAISSKDSSLKSNQNDVSDTAPTQIIHAKISVSESDNRNCTSPNLDSEDLNYETAPTQLIGEVAEKRNSTRTFDRTKADKSSKVDLNDTVERNLNEMFDDVNSDSVHEHALMSTQCLEDILQASQCDTDLFPNKSTVEEKAPASNAPQAKTGKKNSRLSRNVMDSEVNKNDADDSQNSDIYFSTITTRRKRNVINDSQDVIVPTEENNERVTRRTKSVKQKDGTASKTNEQIPKDNSCKGEVDHARRKLADNPDPCVPCSSGSEQGAQRLNTLYEDDDILMRLPAVRISGTLSNPPSPSTSSTSTVRSARFKRDDAKGGKKGKPSKSKSQCIRNVENSSRTDNKSPILSRDNYSPKAILETLKVDKILEAANSEDSDSATSYKRFKQMADRMLSKEENDSKKPGKRNVAVQGASKKKGARSSTVVSEDSKQSSELEGSRNPVQTNSRTRRSSTRQDNESSCVQSTKETRAKDTADKSTKPGTRSTAVKRKRDLNTAGESIRQTNLEKHKADEVTEEAIKKSRETQEASERENIVKPNVTTRTRRKATDSQAATRAKSTNKRTQTKEKETSASQVAEKTLKIMLHSVIVDEESREVERIMMRNVPNDVRDETASIREGSSARLFERESSSSRSTRSRKRANTNSTTDSSSIENSGSSDTSDLESVQSGSIAPTRPKRGRYAKNFVPPPQETRALENEVFKKPTRVTRYSASLTDVSRKNSADDDSRSSTHSNGSLSIRLSRSKTAGQSTWKVEMNESSRKKRTANVSVSPEINTSVDRSTMLTPTRTRRSTSSMSISSPSTGKHRILFTGVKEDKYDNIVRTLGGCTVETPKLCTVLVTDKVRRTYKFLCALAKGVPIVSINWLNDSETAAQFLGWEGYILKDPVAEAKFGFKLRKSLDKAKEKGLLVGYTIVLMPNLEQPPAKELRDMITSCGGRALLSPPATWPDKAMIISREEDLTNARKYLAKAPKTVAVYSAEFIMISILRQEVNFNKHRLI